MERNILALVARYPQPGVGKTRLARIIGPAAAHELYCAFLRDLDDRLATGPWDLCWLYTPDDAPFADWIGAGRRSWPQGGGPLGERLANGMRRLLAEHERAIIMSTDSPQVPCAWIAEGFALLDRRDVTLGPCRDGGYYLVGLRQPHDIFLGIPMSTPAVLTETLAAAARQGLTVGLLPETFDVDDQAGLEELESVLESTDLTLPHTRAVFRNLRREQALAAGTPPRD